MAFLVSGSKLTRISSVQRGLRLSLWRRCGVLQAGNSGIPVNWYSSSEDTTSKDVVKTQENVTYPKGRIGLTDHRVNKLEKLLLVWGGKYKTVDAVPDFVGQDTLERARNKARIKLNIMMAVATLFGCLLMVWSGKKAQQRGETLTKINQEWHRQVKQEAEEAKKEKLSQEAEGSA